MYSENQARDERGRFASGGSGDRYTNAANEKIAIGKRVDASHYENENTRALVGHGLIDRATPVGRHDGNESVGTDHVVNLGGNPLDKDFAATKQAFDQKYGGMSARQHGAAAKSHWSKANSTSGADRAAHIMLGNFHAQARESLGGKGMKS